MSRDNKEPDFDLNFDFDNFDFDNFDLNFDNDKSNKILEHDNNVVANNKRVKSVKSVKKV